MDVVIILNIPLWAVRLLGLEFWSEVTILCPIGIQHNCQYKDRPVKPLGRKPRCVELWIRGKRGGVLSERHWCPPKPEFSCDLWDYPVSPFQLQIFLSNGICRLLADPISVVLETLGNTLYWSAMNTCATEWRDSCQAMAIQFVQKTNSRATQFVDCSFRPWGKSFKVWSTQRS
jgi:hypothetical protein